MFGPTARSLFRSFRILLLGGVCGALCIGVSFLPRPEALTNLELHHLRGALVALVVLHFGIMAAVVVEAMKEVEEAPHEPGEEESLEKHLREKGVFSWVIVMVAGPLLEELLFRGLLLSLLGFLGSFVGVVVTSVLFALAHRRLIHLGGDVAMGLLFGLLAVQVGLWASIFVHAGVNFFVMGLRNLLDRASRAC